MKLKMLKTKMIEHQLAFLFLMKLFFTTLIHSINMNLSGSIDQLHVCRPIPKSKIFSQCYS